MCNQFITIFMTNIILSELKQLFHYNRKNVNNLFIHTLILKLFGKRNSRFEIF